VSGECDYATAASAAGDCDEAARSARRPSSVSLDVGGLSQRERVRRRSVTAPPPLSSLSADRSIHPQPHTNHPALPPCVASDTPLEHVHAPQRRRQRASIQHKGSLIKINIKKNSRKYLLLKDSKKKNMAKIIAAVVKIFKILKGTLRNLPIKEN